MPRKSATYWGNAFRNFFTPVRCALCPDRTAELVDEEVIPLVARVEPNLGAQEAARDPDPNGDGTVIRGPLVLGPGW